MQIVGSAIAAILAAAAATGKPFAAPVCKTYSARGGTPLTTADFTISAYSTFAPASPTLTARTLPDGTQCLSGVASFAGDNGPPLVAENVMGWWLETAGGDLIVWDDLPAPWPMGGLGTALNVTLDIGIPPGTFGEATPS